MLTDVGPHCRGVVCGVHVLALHGSVVHTQPHVPVEQAAGASGWLLQCWPAGQGLLWRDTCLLYISLTICHAYTGQALACVQPQAGALKLSPQRVLAGGRRAGGFQRRPWCEVPGAARARVQGAHCGLHRAPLANPKPCFWIICCGKHSSSATQARTPVAVHAMVGQLYSMPQRQRQLGSAMWWFLLCALAGGGTSLMLKRVPRAPVLVVGVMWPDSGRLSAPGLLVACAWQASPGA